MVSPSETLTHLPLKLSTLCARAVDRTQVASKTSSASTRSGEQIFMEARSALIPFRVGADKPRNRADIGLARVVFRVALLDFFNQLRRAGQGGGVDATFAGVVKCDVAAGLNGFFPVLVI